MARASCRSSFNIRVSLVLLFGLVLASLHVTDADIGVCYGMNGNNLPSRADVIALYKQYNIRKMRLYAPDGEALQSLSNSGIEVMLGVDNPDIENIASSQDAATKWVQDNVQSYPDVNFRYIAVGNEVQSTESSAQHLVQAMENIKNALVSAGRSNIMVSTATYMAIISPPGYPPSAGEIRSDYQPLIKSVIDFLTENKWPLLFNMYPFISYQDSDVIPLDYALFKSQEPVVNDQGNSYNNLFDAMLDTLYTALEKAGGGNLEVVISESGWPTEGGKDASVENANTYNNNLIQHVKGAGTPKRPSGPIETYIFAMFDENTKRTPPDYEKYWGLFSPDKQAKYTVNFN